jgi:hypothetical protein
MSDLTMVPHDSPEWTVMWENLKAASGDYSERCPETNECWQYMGTTHIDRPNIGSLLPIAVCVHQFRHRHRPADAKPIEGFAGDSRRCRVYLDIMASHDYAPQNHPMGGQCVNARFRPYLDPVTVEV